MILLRKAAREMQGRIDFHGLDISVENRMGGIRQWHNPDNGKDGMTRMQRPYGYIKGTLGTDGDHVDVFVGPHRDAANVYVINTMRAPEFTEFDEQKCMLGFRTAAEAVRFYKKHYDDPRFFGSVVTMPLEEFKEKVMQTRTNGGKPLTKSIAKSAEAMCKKLGDSLGVDWNEVSLDEFCDGMYVETEHNDVTGGDPIKTAKIVLAHLRERKDYYTRLERYVEKGIPGIHLLRKARK